MLGTMADAFANPIMVDALILGREGTMVVPDTNYYAPGLPAIDDTTQTVTAEGRVDRVTIQHRNGIIVAVTIG